MKFLAPFILALSALSGLPAAAQDNGCLTLNEVTQFCGRDKGWVPLAEQRTPGTVSFVNEEFLFAVSMQMSHGQTVSSALMERAVSGVLEELDRRMDVPAGTHSPEFVEIIDNYEITGRRMAVRTVVDGQDVHNVIDIYFSPRNAWTTQTGHLGPITLDRLAKVHALVTEDLKLEP